MWLTNIRYNLGHEINEVAQEVQFLVDAEFRKVNDIPPPGSNLEQLGLRDGIVTIKEYTQAHEFGIAFEHLLYMIEETGISLSPRSSEAIRKISADLNLSIAHVEHQLK